MVPQAHQDGFAVVQLKSITVVTPDKLRGEFNATIASHQQSVSELMAENLPSDNPLVHHWEVAATINLYYPPESWTKSPGGVGRGYQPRTAQPAPV